MEEEYGQIIRSQLHKSQDPAQIPKFILYKYIASAKEDPGCFRDDGPVS